MLLLRSFYLLLVSRLFLGGPAWFMGTCSPFVLASSRSLARRSSLATSSLGFVTYQLKRYGLKKNPFRHFKRKSKSKKLPPEWQMEIEKQKADFQSVLEHMERLDVHHELLYQEEILTRTDIFVIAPVLYLSGSVMTTSHATLNPVLYNGIDYNIVFKLGDEYPDTKPFLTIYLASCDKSKARTKQMVPIQAFYYDKLKLDLIPTPIDPVSDYREYKKALEDRDFTLRKTQDGAFYFRWRVPSKEIVFHGNGYCFAFDMSSLDPSKLEMSTMHNLKQRKPKGWFSWLKSRWHYHKLRVSPPFQIKPQPPIFSIEWFSRQFGGSDLSRFMGGDLFCFTFFQTMFTSGAESASDVWRSDDFNNHVNDRASSVADWFSTIIDDTAYRFERGFFTSLQKYDTGYSDAEDRRKARMRANGLLYHPHGRKTLERIGKSLVTIANEFENANGPMGNMLDQMAKLKHMLVDSWKSYFGSFQSARQDLAKWITRLRIFNPDRVPTQSDLDEITKALNGATNEEVYLPLTGEKVYPPERIKMEIMKCMDELVANEIRLVLWKMGDKLLERRSGTSLAVHATLKLSLYNYPKLLVYAAVLKTYGTKFEWMAKNYALFNSDRYESMRTGD